MMENSGHGGGDGCTTRQMYLMLRNWTLQMVKMANSMCVYFTTILKKLYCVPIMCKGLILAGEERQSTHKETDCRSSS